MCHLCAGICVGSVCVCVCGASACVSVCFCSVCTDCICVHLFACPHPCARVGVCACRSEGTFASWYARARLLTCWWRFGPLAWVEGVYLGASAG